MEIHVKESNINDKKMKGLYGKCPETGDLFPAIPRFDNTPDVSHIIKEIFQEYLKDELPTYETAKNMQITCKDNQRLKNYADNVVTIYEDHNKTLQDIASVEEQMMKNHARFILKKDKIQKNVLLNSIMGMKPRPIFKPLDEKTLQKYPLIEANDVFCEEEARDRVGFQKNEPDAITRYLISDDKNLPLDLINPPYLAVKYKPPKIAAKKEEKTQKRKRTSLKESSIIRYITKPKEHLIRVEPHKINFSSYDRDYLYQETLYIQNIGKNVIRLQVLPFKEISKFKLQWSEKLGGIITVAAGLSIAAKVEFYCTSLDDTADELILKIEDGEDIKVPVVAKRQPPVLEATEPEYFFNFASWSLEKWGVEATLECGVILVGDNVLHSICLFNDGGDGSFWIMSEEEWTHCEIKNGNFNNVLKIPPFSFTPFYFDLKSKEEINLCVLYEPKMPGLQIEHVKILCDNCVIHSLNVLADAVFFDSKFISFTNLKKIFAVEVDDDVFADYFFNIGRILPNGCVQKSFYLTNESDLELQFHWKKRFIKFPVISENPPHTLLHVPLDYISIIPSEGTISPKSDQHFIVKCALRNGERGHYRAILSFFIENLPWQSVRKESFVRKCVVNPNYIERVDVLLNEIELWVECVPLAVMLQPCIIKITSGKLRCNTEPVLPKLTIANTTLDDIEFHWMPVTASSSEPAAASVVEMLIKFGSIKTKTFMVCPLKVTTLSHGLLLQEIRCSINEGERFVEMMICAQVAEPQIYPSTYILNFGTVKKNNLVSQQLKIKNGSNATVVWTAREFKYNFDSGSLKITKCGLSADSGCFSQTDSVCTVDYILNTKNPEIWISIIELSVVSLSHRYRQHFVLVVGDIQEPQLIVKAPPHSIAFLCPTNPLFLGIPVVTSVVLCNYSNVPGKFKWGVPLGQDVHKMKFDVKPRSGVILPRKCMTLNILIIPLQMGSVSSFYIPCFGENINDPVVLGVKCEVKGLRVTFALPTEVVTGHESTSEVHIPWSDGDKLEFPAEMLPNPVEEYFKWPLNTQTYHFENTHKDSHEVVREQDQENEANGIEKVIQKVDYDTGLNENYEHVKEVHEIKDESNDEEEIIVLDGKIGNLYVEGKLRLVLHFQLWENSDLMKTHIYENAHTQGNEKEIDKLPDIELPPFHTYPLASEELEEESILNSLSDSVMAKSTLTNSEDVMKTINDKGSGLKGMLQESFVGSLHNIIKESGDKSLPDSEESTSNEQLKPNDLSQKDKKTNSQQTKSNTKENRKSKVQEIQPYIAKTQKVREIIMKNVKVKQIASAKFFIQNETPIDARVEVSANNFPPNIYIKIEDIIESVFCETTFKEQDKIECCILQGNGVVIFVKQQSKNLNAYEVVEVELIVYANTWGIYYETIICNITGLPTFYIKLTVEVHGQPISFALAPPDLIYKFPIRFGTMRYGSEHRVRSLKLYNDSCVSLNVAWHLFMKEIPLTKSEAEKEMLFNVVLDVYTISKENNMATPCLDKEGNQCQDCERQERQRSEVMDINMVPYMGKEDYSLFQIYPRETKIGPKSSKVIEVSFNPPKNEYFDNTFFAYLIGFIKVHSKDIYSKGRFYRPHGKYLPPIWATLHAEVEMPSFSLETDSDDLEFFVEAACVLSQPNKHYTVTQLLVIKNNFKSPITALVDTEKPFFIKEVNTMAHRHTKIMTDVKEDIVFTLLPGECAEIKVFCIIDEKYILQIQETFWNATNKGYSREEQEHFSKKSAVIECPLNLVQPNIMEQTVKLKLLIEFPIVTVSTDKIDFGPVFVGHSKWAIFEIENQTVSNVWFKISKIYQTTEFSLKPSCGVLVPVPLYGRSSLQIKITFSPTESMSYMDYIKIQTCVPGDERIILVEGVGTPDTKFESDF